VSIPYAPHKEVYGDLETKLQVFITLTLNWGRWL